MTVWQQSFELLVPLLRDKTTKNYPSDERFGLISDMRPPDRIIRAGRSANSIAPPARAGLRDLAAFPRDPLESLRIAFIHKDAVHKISCGSAYPPASRSGGQVS